MSFLPPDFEPPLLLETERFRMRPLDVNDVVKDYDAVMSSRDHLWEMFGEAWGWPRADLTLEQDRKDLEWHQDEFERRSSFAYEVMSPDESRLLGCVYIDPPKKRSFDAEVFWWVRVSELETGLHEELGAALREWLASEWPFEKVAFPGRDIAWADYRALPGA
jgi:GNAT acetyltransferase-like protein